MFLLKNFSTVMVSYSTNMVVNAIINLKASFLTKNLPDLKKVLYLKMYGNKSMYIQDNFEIAVFKTLCSRTICFCKAFSFRVLP